MLFNTCNADYQLCERKLPDVACAAVRAILAWETHKSPSTRYVSAPLMSRVPAMIYLLPSLIVYFIRFN